MRDPSLSDVSEGDYLCVGVWGTVDSVGGKGITLDVERVAAIDQEEPPTEETGTEPAPEAGPEETPAPVPAAATPNPIATLMNRKR